jgi:hypothetical protein
MTIYALSFDAACMAHKVFFNDFIDLIPIFINYVIVIVYSTTNKHLIIEFILVILVFI